ncbi:flagellar hook protein FlgE [Paraburkholderia terricola]|uniref:Flagellar hook protein FlgE n=1 Tax=Paraburkholderia terricola TaxID=169427 RepID=A0ABU1LX49_9BURK|nr:flagellar hook-basal body complex protein [Paraburkholderia terricola]MDR6411318.1 flagellar hook protein FlgE [Paraburkholderia terricola]MDR6483442.1 flagellar hook protein FlgE [Paraburkholderia terricola]
MLESVYIGMSGLTAYSRGLQTISNNVANLNTAGFKTSTPRFADLYYGQQFAQGSPGSGKTMQFGSGVEYGYSSLNFAQGDLRASSGQLDLAIQGNGFLALLDGSTTRYARTGQFAIGDDGFIEDKASGLKLAALTSSGSLEPIALDGKQINPPQATTVIQFADNLSSGSTNFSIPNVEVYDANGGKHTLTIAFAPDSSIIPGRWQVTVTDENKLPLQQGTLQFNGGIPEPGADKIDFTLNSPDAPPLTVTLDFSTGVTGFSAGSTSSLRVSNKDGYATGTLSSMNVDADGQLILQYSNGQTDTLGAIALASFSNPQPLLQMGNGLFDASQASPPQYRTSSGAGVGQLIAGASEASNVDLSTEFGQLILIQRGFQASSQVVSAANEMIMQLFQMRGQG